MSKVIFVYICLSILLLGENVYSFDFQRLESGFWIATTEVYDDNITFIKDKKKEDFITKVNLGLDLKYEGKTQAFVVGGGITQQIFARYHNYNNTSQHLSLNFYKEFSPYSQLRLTDSFAHTYEPRSFEEAFGRTGGRYSYYRNKFNLIYIRDISKYLNIRAIFANEINEVSRQGLRDSTLNQAGFNLNYFWSPSIILKFNYSFFLRDFTPGEGASTHSIVLGLRNYLSSQLYFDFRGGMEVIESFNDKNYIRPLIQALVTGDIDENTRVKLAFTKKYYTNAYTEDLFNYWRVSAFLTRRLLKRLRGSLLGFYGEGRYVAIGIRDKLNGVTFTFTFDVGRDIKANFSYTNSRVDSTDIGREYIKNTVGLGVTIKF
ncbi:MAG: hypothetical protein B6D56_07335 [Candidatus Omnitrophica bacterium 4484_70.1]|nr:MAG: hypothetical protein B6D56_07335 [Candidatus Omnitrophica bacterium 4484_70.1]